MKKAIAIATGFLLLTTGAASAQVYNSFYNVVNPSVCANLTTDLSVGSHGSQVRALQTFLVAQNYSGGGSWMITGNYGQATAAAVRLFQQQVGLPVSGWVDAATRFSINQAGCGSNYGYTNPNTYNVYNNNYGYTYPDYSYPNNFYGNYNNSYPYNYNYYQNTSSNCGVFPYFYSCYNNVGSAPTLTSLSTTYALPGNVVTIYGTGFDSSNNTVYIGGTSLRNISSYNGMTLSFTVPANTYGTVSVSVGNTFGTSNALTLNTGGNTNVCSTYPYNQNGYGGYCPPATNGQITIYPASGAVGTNVTIYGWNFTQTNNTVHFGNGIIANLSSYDGRSISFTVPTTISGYGYQPIGLGAYNVSVTNGSGQTSGAVPFTITSLGGGTNTSNNVALNSISPSYGSIGTQIMLIGNGFNSTDNTVHFGIGGTLHVPSSNNGTVIYYTVPQYVNPCDLASQGNLCSINVQPLLPGPVQVSVSNGNGTSQNLMFQVQ
jgi:peptidoglycan hydrolase-like protein with peptidoglycan-binding domain